MKSHISITIESDLVEELKRFGREERRSRSQSIELALEDFFRQRRGNEDKIVISSGRFMGHFSREETYAR